jgi:hypothetical protein
MGWAGTFVFNLVRAPKLLHDELAGDLAIVKAELKAKSANLDLTILEGIFVDTSPLQLLLLVRAVNKGVRVTVRDWELLLDPGGFAHSPAPIPHSLKVKRDFPSDDEEPLEAIPQIDRIARSTALETNVGVEGWLLFAVRGKLSLEQAMDSTLTLKAQDDLGQPHAVTVRRSDYILSTGTII